MKFTLIFLIAFTALISCSQTETNNNISNTDTIKQVSKVISADSLQYLKDSVDNAEPDLKLLRAEYIKDYSKIEKMDTTFKDKSGNEISVFTKYYCLFDNSITVPKYFVWEDTTKTFTTHNFAQDIKIVINKQAVFNETITKSNFETDIEDESQKKYSVLLYPNFHFDNEREVFVFSYSLTIPLTDVGSGRSLEIDKKGKMTKSDR